MRGTLLVLVGAGLLAVASGAAWAGEVVHPDYGEQKVVYDFYFDEPEKAASALYWLRAHMKPLQDAPYNIPPDFLDIKVVIHGTEIVTVARKNGDRFPDIVQRMRYYDRLGVDFKVCGLAARDYGYQPEDFYDFVDVVPSAMTELAHWQARGYSLMVPRVFERQEPIEAIR